MRQRRVSRAEVVQCDFYPKVGQVSQIGLHRADFSHQGRLGELDCELRRSDLAPFQSRPDVVDELRRVKVAGADVDCCPQRRSCGLPLSHLGHDVVNDAMCQLAHDRAMFGNLKNFFDVDDAAVGVVPAQECLRRNDITGLQCDLWLIEEC